MRKHLSTIALVLVLLAGLSLMLYPTVSDWWNSMHQSRAIASYSDTVAELDHSRFDELLAQARAYNETLIGRDGRFVMSEEEQAVYDSLLDVSGTGIMGYVEIPKIDCSLPIYHGTEESVLQIAIGHLEWSSLPVGGESTHCVLSGHRGLPSAKLFTNLDKLQEGDVFMLRVLDEVLTYEVDQIRIVLPDEVEELAIKEGEDLCTLFTCTPYGINTHRLLVRGRRVEGESSLPTINVANEAYIIDPIIVAPAAAVPMLLLLLIWLLVKYRKKKS